MNIGLMHKLWEGSVDVIKGISAEVGSIIG